MHPYLDIALQSQSRRWGWGLGGTLHAGTASERRPEVARPMSGESDRSEETVGTGQYGLDSCDHHLSGDRAAPKGAATVYEGEGGRGRRRWLTAGASEAEMGGFRA